MNKAEKRSYWEESVKRYEQEHQSTLNGTEKLQLGTAAQKRVRRNYERDQKRAEADKEHANLVVGKWKEIDANKQKKLAEQRIQQARQQQGLRERYPDLFPKPNKPA